MSRFMPKPQEFLGRLRERVKSLPKSDDSKDIWIETRELPSSSARDDAEEPEPSSVSNGPNPKRTKKRLAKWIIFFTWLSALLYLTPLLALWGTGLVNAWGPRLVTGNPLFASSFSGESACQPGGNFNPFADTYTSWTLSGFFEISIAFGSLSFTEAKVVDAVWDLLVGRIGQGIIALIWWRVLAFYVAASINTSGPVTYDTFWTVFLHQEASFVGLYRLFADGSFYRALRHKIVAVFTVLSLVLVIAFPTFVSAMTGYVVKTEAYVKDSPGETGNYIKFSEFDVVAYVIHDGWRIGKTGDYLVPYGSLDHTMGKREPLVLKSVDYLPSACGPWLDESGCEFLPLVSSYVRQYGFYGLNQTPSVWAGQTELEPPALNITAFYLLERGYTAGRDWAHPDTGRSPFRNSTNMMYMLSNKTYDLDYINTYGRCQSNSDVYQWGFSYVQLFVLVVALLIWTIGIWMVWFKARINQQPGEVPNGWKGLLHLASVIKSDLSATGIDPIALSDDQLRAEIQRHLQGGTVSFEFGPESSITTIGTARTDIAMGRFIWQKTRAQKWWVVVTCCVHFGFTGFAFFFVNSFPYTFSALVVIGALWLTSLGLYMLLLVGRTKWLWACLPCSWVGIAVACVLLFGQNRPTLSRFDVLYKRSDLGLVGEILQEGWGSPSWT